MKCDGKLLYFGVCTKTLRTLLTAAMLSLAATFSLSAQKVSAGALFSAKGCGVAVAVPAAGGECTVLISALADFSGLLLGKTKYPGCMARFYYDYTIFSKEFAAGDSFTLYAGPGAMLGYVRDTDGIYGAATALSGELGLAYFPIRRVRISFGFNVDLGLHFDSGGDKKTRIYMDGLIRSWMPQIGLMYCF